MLLQTFVYILNCRSLCFDVYKLARLMLSVFIRGLVTIMCYPLRYFCALIYQIGCGCISHIYECISRCCGSILQIPCIISIIRVFKSSSVSVYGKVGDDDSISVPLFNENEEDLQTQLRIEREAKENYYAKLIDMAEKYEEEKKVKEDAVRSLSYAESMWKASEKAKDEALSRLSEHVALKLANNNPNIADLSDINRPTNLVEKFSSLYDDEWTEAFDTLAQLPEYKEEKKVIQLLLTIVQECFNFCREQSSSQLKQLLSAYDTAIESIPTELLKSTKETRKKYAAVHLPALHKKMFDYFNEKFGIPLQDAALQAYVRRCTEICWLMSVQDPPMAISTALSDHHKHDKTSYRDYMKVGAYIDYVVWPCVLIQDGGSLMCKGIAEGCDQVEETLITID